MRIALAAALAFAGCGSLGPKTVATDRFDYSAAISDSWKRQTLLNIVKLRYFDPPIFVDVGQVVSAYSLETTASVGGTLNFPNTPDAVSMGAQGKFTDRPTITYVPLTGNKFVGGLMTPIPPESLFFAIQSGWSADAMLTLGLSSINGLRNEDTSISGQRPADERFRRVAELMRAFQDNGALSVRVNRGTDKTQSSLLAIRSRSLDAEGEKQVAELRELLGLDPDVNEFRLVFGATNVDGHEIAVVTRSLLKVIATLSLRAELPAEHIAEGRAVPGLLAGDPKTGFVVHSGVEAPKDAFVAVAYRGHWFWVDDRDLVSKRTFSFIMLLFTLSDTAPEQGLPVITIPAQ